MSYPALLPLLAILSGLVAARSLPAPHGPLPLAVLLALYVAAVAAFVVARATPSRCTACSRSRADAADDEQPDEDEAGADLGDGARDVPSAAPCLPSLGRLADAAFLPLLLAAVACAAWWLGTDANRLALHPPLLDTFARLGGHPRRTDPSDPQALGSAPRASAGSPRPEPVEGQTLGPPDARTVGPVVVEGILRQDASLSAAGGATLSLEVRRLHLPGDLAGAARGPMVRGAEGPKVSPEVHKFEGLEVRESTLGPSDPRTAGPSDQPLDFRTFEPSDLSAARIPEPEVGEVVAASGGIVASVSGQLAATRLDDWRTGRLVRAPALLREPTIYRNPGLRDERTALARRGIHLFASIKSGALVEVAETAGWWDERAADVRAFARRAIGQAVGRWSQQSAAIVIAILIGDRAGLTDEVERRLQEAGTYHVIAISGGNIAILAGFLLGLFRLLGVPRRVSAVATMVVLALYADLVGGGASVSRATLMAVTYLVALTFDLRGRPVNALLATAYVLLSVEPLSMYDVAFALTFGATIGILVAAGAVGPRLPRRGWVSAPAALLLASASAELALLPVGAYAFSRVTFAGLVLNFLAIPLMAVAQLAGMIVLPLGLVNGGLAAVAGFLAHLGAGGLVWTASFVDLVQFLVWRVPAPAGVVIATYYAGWLLWLAAPGIRRSASRMRLVPVDLRRRAVGVAARTLQLGAVAMLTSSTIWILWSPLARVRGARPTGLLRMTVLDVGQADSILLRFPDATAWLIDAGGSRAGGSFDVGGRVIAPALWSHDVFGLGRFVLSHGDPDHLGGAVSLLRDFRVGEFVEGIDVPRDAALQRVRRQAAARGIACRQVRAGERTAVGGTEVTIWHPPAPDWERQKVRNDDSIVMTVRLGDVVLLLTGDIGRDVERGLAARLSSADAPLCVLKVPHHGSTSSSSPGFLAAVQPALAIFTVGASSLRTPGVAAVVARYRALGSHVADTATDGAIEIETDGREVRVATFTGRRYALHGLRAPGPGLRE